MNHDTALLIIDVQEGFKDPKWGRRNNPRAEENVARLLAAWREAGLPVFHAQHLSRNPKSPLRPGQPGVEFMAQARPLAGEPVVQKSVNSAFIGTDLEARLRVKKIARLVIGGLVTDHCISTTTRMAANLGFEVFVAADATAAHDRVGPDGTVYDAETVHRVSLASLHGEFAEVAETEEIVRRIRSAAPAL
jgi:nicotinamidase-related amidase